MQVRVVNFHPMRSGPTMQGQLEVEFPEVGLQLKGIALHDDGGRRWLQLPAKPYTRGDGGQGWRYILRFVNKERFNKFQEVVLDQLGAFQREGEGHGKF